MVPGLKLVLYGSEGVGKTGLALQHSALGPLRCISCNETGFEELEIVDEVPDGCTNFKARSWEDLVKYTKSCEEKVLVIDSLSGVQTFLFDYVCRTVYRGDFDKFSSYWKGQRVDAPIFMQSYLDELDRLRADGVHIILTAHMVTTTEPNTLGADYLCHVIDMDQGDKGGVRSTVTKWAQAIIFMNIDVSITRATDVAKDKTVMEGKAKDDDNRLMYTTKAPGHSAKNRLQLPPIINMGENAKEAWQNLWKVMPKKYQELM